MPDFATDLRAWMDRNKISSYAAAKWFGASSVHSITGWLAGKNVTFEPSLRARMRETDADRTAQK